MEHSLKSIILLLLTSPLCLSALGGKPDVVKGECAYEISGPNEVLKVSDKTILEYQKFNIDKQESVRYEQPTSKSTLLCRVKGRDPSNIKGKLEANGKLLFINPNGIIFSETAHVKVGTLLASTLDLHNDDFLNDSYKFRAVSEKKSIINKGRIEADHNVVLMAPNVINQGVIVAKAGKIALMGGEAITLDFDGDEMIQFAVDAPLASGLIEQGGQLIAGEVHLRLPMAQKAIRTVLNDTGVIEAGRIEIENGVIRLAAGSSTQAKTLHASGDTIQVGGELKVPGVCELKADQDVLWLKENQVGHLRVEADRFILAGGVKTETLNTAIGSHYVLGASLDVHNNPLSFNAPVILRGKEVALSTGDVGGPLTFLDVLKSGAGNTNLFLSAGSGDIEFKSQVSLENLEILSAHNVTTPEMNLNAWVQKNVKGLTTLAGPITAKTQIALEAYALKIDHPLTVMQGPISIETTGQMKVSETVTLTADSIVHNGTGNLLMGGKWIAQNGAVSIDGAVQLLGDVLVEAGKGNVHFKNSIGGLGGLTVRADNINMQGDIGRIAYFTADASNVIHLGSCGKGNEGIEGMLTLSARGPIYFHGADYVAAGHTYYSGASYNFDAGQKTTIFARSMIPIRLQEVPVLLGENTTLEIRSSQGPIELTSVQGKAGSHLKVNTPNSHIKIGAVEAGSLHLVAAKPIHLSQPMTATTGDFIVDAPLFFESSEALLNCLHGSRMYFGKGLNGNIKLALQAPEGEIILGGSLRGAKKFQQINLNAKKITQHESVVSTGPVHYAADQIFLGNDIQTDNAITLDGPVTLFKNDAIILTANKYNKGPILLTSTLDADAPTRTLTFQNEKSLTQIKGAIGTHGPLGELVLNSGKIFLHQDVGGSNPGVFGRIALKSVEVEFKGSHFHTGEQLWNTTAVHLTHEGAVELKTTGLPLRFGQDARIELDHTTALSVITGGGLLDLAPVISDHPQPITILAGHGEAHLKEIGKQVTQLHVEGRDILLSGHVEAGQVFMEAEHHLEYDLTKGKEIISTAIQSKGDITLNSKRSVVGTAEKPLNINTTGELYVGAKTVAYLEGRCAGQNPHVYPPNPPKRTFFNGYEINNACMDDLIAEDEALLQTLTPALGQKVPTSFMDGSAIKPRKAPIYYDTSGK